MSWEIKINWDGCHYLKEDYHKQLLCKHYKNKTILCNKENCPIKV